MLKDTQRSREWYLVTVTIQSLLKAVQYDTQNKNPEFSFDPIQEGSTSATRPFLPNEFDFLLHCERVQRLLWITQDRFIQNNTIIDMETANIHLYPNAPLEKATVRLIV